MIDLHSHILPSLDDGAKTIEESLQMARLAVSEGIGTIIASPHHKNGVYENEKARIQESIRDFREQLEINQIPLTVLAGQEVRLYGELIEDLENGSIRTIHDTKYVLIEFPSSYIPRYAKRLFFELLQREIHPILVHPERNRAIVEKPNLLYDLVQMGVSAQLTCGSLTGKFGKKIKKVSADLIAANLVHFIASDAHNVSSRQFWMLEARAEIEKQFGSDHLYYYEENARLVIEGHYITREMPQQVKQRKFLGLF